VAFPEQAKEREALSRSTLHVEDLVLRRFGYRHGNFVRVGSERLDELLEPFGIGVSQA